MLSSSVSRLETSYKTSSLLLFCFQNFTCFPNQKTIQKKVLLNTGFVVSFLILGKIQKYCLNKKFELPLLGKTSCSFLPKYTMWSVNDGAAGTCCCRFSTIYQHKSPNQWYFPPKTDRTWGWKYC